MISAIRSWLRGDDLRRDHEKNKALGQAITARFAAHREYRERVLDREVRRYTEMPADEQGWCLLEFLLWSAAGDRIIEDAQRWEDRK